MYSSSMFRLGFRPIEPRRLFYLVLTPSEQKQVIHLAAVDELKTLLWLQLFMEIEIDINNNQQMDGHIKLWSYNLFLRPPPIKNNEDDFKEQRFKMIMDRISDYDICCFQELFQTATFRAEDLITAAVKKGFYYWKLCEPTSFFSGKPTDAGLAIISKYPIAQSHFQSYEIGILSDGASNKGYIYCRIQINKSTLHLFNTHLQASYAGQEDLKELSIVTRRQQCKILRNRMKAVLSPNYTSGDLVLMVGDFNIDAKLNPSVLSPNSPIKCGNPNQFDEYSDLIDLLSGKPDGTHILNNNYRVRDLLHQNLGHHPTTYGEESKCILTDRTEFGNFMRLDYVFQIEQEQTKLKLQADLKSCKVDKNLVEGKPFVQLSDHFSLSMVIIDRSV